MRKILMPTIMALLFVSTVFAGLLEKATEQVEVKDANYVDIEGNLGAGVFKITTDDISQLALFDIKYDKRTVRYDVDYYERNSKGYLTFESKHRNHGDFNDNDNENNWEITLSNKYESVMDLDIGAADADMDLGGLPLKELSIDIGAASGDLSFSKANPIRMKHMSIDAGATSLNMHSVGNANFEFCEFSGGVGSFDLDFRGEYKGESEISIEIGLGSADIVLPRNVPIRVISDDVNWFSSVDFHDDDLDRRHNGEYESPGFADAETRIILRLDVGMGSIDLYWKD